MLRGGHKVLDIFFEFGKINLSIFCKGKNLRQMIMRILLRFTELNQYGLPRAVGEVEMSLGTFKLHVFPHQVGKK